MDISVNRRTDVGARLIMDVRDMRKKKSQPAVLK